MKIYLSAFCFILSFLAFSSAPAAAPADQGGECPPEQASDSSGICRDAGQAFGLFTRPGTGVLQPLLELQKNISTSGESTTQGSPLPTNPESRKIIVYFFWGRGCPHCEKEKVFLAELKNRNPTLAVKDFEVWYDKKNAALLSSLLQASGMRPSGVPVTFIGRRVFLGFAGQTQGQIEAAIKTCLSGTCEDLAAAITRPEAGGGVAPLRQKESGKTTPDGDRGESVDIPLLGVRDARSISLPVLTLFIAGLDSFNPCAFFVLLTLLGLLLHAQSRRKMLLVGGVFVFFSGVIYFVFMAAWLNLFLIMGRVAVITTIAGGVSILIAAINIKDFFLFKRGVSLTIPDSAKPRLFDRMRKLLRSTSLFSILLGTTVLAVVANSYELLCTAGFPMVFTRILTLSALPWTSYYLYLVLYNVIYIVPLLLIVLVFTVTLGSRKLSERQGRLLKLVSGVMMLGLGAVLIVNPTLLNSPTISFVLLAGALGVSLLLGAVTRRLGY